MTLTATDHDAAVDYRVTRESSLTAAAVNNVTSGPGTFYSIFINHNNNEYIYIKVVNAYSATAGSTAPTWIFPCAATSTNRYEIPGGEPFDALSIWCTINPSPADSTGPTLTGNEAVEIYLVTT